MNLEQAKKRLEQLTSRKDPMTEAFHGGRVGFRKPTKKYSQEIERTFKEAGETVKLREFIDREESKQAIVLDFSKSRYYSEPSEILEGRIYQDCIYGRVTVVKRNKKTVTIKTQSGFICTREPKFIFK